MVRVPNVVPDVPALPNDPVVACFADFFSQPAPFRADAKVDIEPVADQVTAMLDCHASQIYEWIPHTLGRDAEVPTDPAERLRWLPEFYGRGRAVARRFAPEYRLAEAFEISEYARKPKPEELPLLFPGIRSDIDFDRVHGYRSGWATGDRCSGPACDAPPHRSPVALSTSNVAPSFEDE